MSEMPGKWSRRDLRFLVETLVPERKDIEQVVNSLGNDEELLEAMLQDDRLFQRLISDGESFLLVSPHFFFKILLLRAQRDLEQEVYTVERRHLQKVVLFDAERVVEFMADRAMSDYLAGMLASFTRVQSTTIPIRVRPGIWRRLRVNDLDVDSMIRYAQALGAEQSFAAYQRIGDACLFLTGLFPEHVDARARYPHSGQPRPRLRGSLLHDLEDYEQYGRSFYQLAAEHKKVPSRQLQRVLTALSERFILAEKPLAVLGERYLSLRKHRLFEL
jgi:hypothetical protein